MKLTYKLLGAYVVILALLLIIKYFQQISIEDMVSDLISDFINNLIDFK